MKKLLKEEFVKFWFGFVSTTVGVFLALMINSYVDKQKDREAYNLMIKALNIEASENQKILTQSFLPNYEKGIIFREFNLKLSDDLISNETVLEHASPGFIKALTAYSLNLRRANCFRERDEKYKYEQEFYQKWQPHLTESFSKVLIDCTGAINELIKE